MKDFEKMKNIKSFFWIFVFFLLSMEQVSHASEAGNSQLRWHNNYQEALDLAKRTSRPVVLFFTGSDWCGWCNKLEKEVLDTADFQQNAGDKMIFVKLDYPMKTLQSPWLKDRKSVV